MTPNLVLGLMTALSVAYAGYRLWQWPYDLGHASRDTEVMSLITERDKVHTELKALKDEQTRQHRLNQNALAAVREQAEASKKELQDVETELQALRTRRPISVAADARCIVPSGFVRLHNLPVSGGTGGPSGDDDAPSGIALSQVGDTVSSNYQSCQQAISRLKLWQDWYRRTRGVDKPD